jgi:CysZ protein
MSKTPTTPRKARLGFFDGVSSFASGIGFIVGRPAMWGWALIPAVVATTLFVGLAALAIWGGTSLAERALWDPGDGAWTTAGIWLLRVLFYVVGIVVAFLVAISLAQPLSGFALDAIARRQERALSGREWPDQPLVVSTLRSLRVTFTALALSLPALAVLTLVTLLVPPASVVTIPLKFLVTGLAVAYDFLDYPLGLRGVGVRARMAFIRTHFSAVLGFGVAAALVLLVPGVGLFLLPFGVAGAARMVAAADGACEVPTSRATTRVT